MGRTKYANRFSSEGDRAVDPEAGTISWPGGLDMGA